MATYAQIVLKTPDAQAVQACLSDPQAKVFQSPGFAIMEIAPDEDQLQEAARELSRCTGAVALAVLNQDDTRLVLSAYRAGEWLDYFDSNPMHLGCRVCSYAEESITGEGGNAQTLAELFGVPEKAKALRHWLSRRRGLGFLYELQRHAAIAQILGLPQPNPVTSTA